MLGNVESTIYAFSTNKWPQMWPQEQIEWATGNLLLDSRDRFRERSGSYQSVADDIPTNTTPCTPCSLQATVSTSCWFSWAWNCRSRSSRSLVMPYTIQRFSAANSHALDREL